MKKILLIITLFIFTPFSAFASGETDAQLLKNKLAKFKQINANFSQVVSSPEGQVLNESSGQLTILRPGKFHWQVLKPEKELIVSDGKTMWLYSPFIEQVTLMNLRDAIEGTPFVLLSGGDDKQWQKYSVIRDKKRFTVNPLDTHLHHNTIVFEFNAVGNISRFVVIEEQGQRSEFTLTHKPLRENLSSVYFNFKIPAGVEIDDQR